VVPDLTTTTETLGGEGRSIGEGERKSPQAEWKSSSWWRKKREGVTADQKGLDERLLLGQKEGGMDHSSTKGSKRGHGSVYPRGKLWGVPSVNLSGVSHRGRGEKSTPRCENGKSGGT